MTLADALRDLEFHADALARQGGDAETFAAGVRHAVDVVRRGRYGNLFGNPDSAPSVAEAYALYVEASAKQREVGAQKRKAR